MIKAVLLDLDDTLISNPLNRTDQSLDDWNAFFGQMTGRADAGVGLLRAMAAVTQNTNPVARNFDIFLEVVTGAWGVSRERAVEIFRAFYAETYAHLRTRVAPRPSAPVLLDWLRQHNYLVVIATNPLFMAEGLAERMRWGAIPADFSAYAHVTHIENSHFAKPMPHYYEEVLGRLGVASNEAIMVGDDWENDIAAAERAGLNTFWVRPDGASPGVSPAQPDGQGTFHDFTVRVCNQGWLDTLQPRPLRPEMITPRLLGNVGALFGLLQEYASRRWDQHPLPGEWSPLEVVCHLRDSERTVQRPRLQRIASENNPFLTEPQTPPGPGEMACNTNDQCDPANEFVAERQITLDFLASLTPQQWHRPARHSIFGPTTLLEMADFTARHDRMHIKQLCQTLRHCE